MEKLSKLSLKYKIFLIPALAATAFACYLLFTIVVTSENSGRINRAIEVEFPVLSQLDANIARLEKLNQTLITAALTANQSMLNDASEISTDYSAALDDIALLAPAYEEQITDHGDVFRDFYESAQSSVTKVISAETSEDTTSIIRAINNQYDDTLLELQALRETHYAQFVDTLAASNSASLKVVSLGGGLGLLALLAILLVGGLNAIMITRRINLVVKSLREIASGKADLTQRLEQHGSDELGELSLWFNKLMEQLHQIIKQISGSTEPLVMAASKLASVTQQSANRGAAQRTATNHIQSAMTEMSGMVQDVASKASEAVVASSEAGSQSRHGNAVVEANKHAIIKMANEVEKATDVIQQLELDSTNVGMVLDVIRSIADQTNLLALNAAIEAARAGEQGRGFSVVADEVRTLATRTQESTQEIQNIVEQLQTAAQTAVKVMHDGKEQANNCVERIDDVTQSLNQIGQAVELISELNSWIAGATEQQQRSANGISSNIDEISAVVDDSVNNARQVAEISDELNELGESLYGMSKRFKT